MKTFYLLLFTFIISLVSFSQLPPVNVCLGTDISVCQGQQVNISPCAGGTGAGIYLNSPSLLTFTDDEYSAAVNIGFNFNFFGNNYNQIVLGSNGIVTFDLTQASGYCPWSSTILPNSSTGGVQNSIALSWQDLYFPFAGGLAYQTIGTAPNRQFVISYENVSYFSSACQTPADCFTASIVLYEGSNLIDMFISNKSFCLAWNNGLAVQGIQNATGTVANVVAGRNNTAWGAILDGQRFTPITPTNYSISTTPFQTVSSAFSTTTQWKNTLGQTFPYINGTPLSIASPPIGTTGYFLTATTCGAAIASISDTTFITTLSTSVSTTMTPDDCNLGIGSVTATPQTGTAPYTYSWSNGATTPIVTGLLPGIYTVTMTTADLCPSTSTITVTETPALTATITSQQDVLCNSGNTGMVTILVTQGVAPYTYSWNQSTSTTNSATDLIAGSNTVTVTDINGCTTSITATLAEPPLLSITTLTPDTLICPENNITLNTTGTGGSSAYTFTWTENGVVIGTGTSIIVDPLNSGAIYCVTLTEACGSPSTQDCMIVTFPPTIIPSLVPDEIEKCSPSKFEFTNTSGPASDIASTNFDFGDNTSTLELLNDSTSHYYSNPDSYTISMTITSIHNCVYSASFNGLITAQASPIASFNINSNPTTIFNTTVEMQENSSSNVVSWEWSSPGSTVTSSNIQNPTFSFPEGIVNQYPITLYVTTALGCTDSTTHELNVIPEVILYAPNAFTPDGDEHNNSWKIFVQGIDETQFHMFIFNRWGEIVWETNDVQGEWDGTYKGAPVSEGVYNWTASVKDLYSDKKRPFIGSISLLK